MNKIIVLLLLTFQAPGQERLFSSEEKKAIKQLYTIAEEEGWFISKYGAFTIQVSSLAEGMIQWRCSIMYVNNLKEKLPSAYAYIYQVPLFFYGIPNQISQEEAEAVAKGKLYVNSEKKDRRMPVTHDQFRNGYPIKTVGDKILMAENRGPVAVDHPPNNSVFFAIFDRDGKLLRVSR
jgi:hypothetical protein